MPSTLTKAFAVRSRGSAVVAVTDGLPRTLTPTRRPLDIPHASTHDPISPALRPRSPRWHAHGIWYRCSPIHRATRVRRVRHAAPRHRDFIELGKRVGESSKRSLWGDA